MQPLWTPSEEHVAASNLTDFMRFVSQCVGQDIADYDALHAWSVEDVAAFWALYAVYAELGFSSGPKTVMSDDPMPRTKWFEGATLNYAEALLFPPKLTSPDQAAVIAATETGAEQVVSYAELRELVARCAAALKREGVGKGDRVAAVATNTPETLAVLLACASFGAVFSSCSPDFGLGAAQARFGQVEPKVLFAAPFYFYGGKRFDTSEMVQALAGELNVKKTVLLPYPGEAAVEVEGAVTWEGWLESDPPALTLTALPFDHPLYILFSSGTTGLPKAIVHRAGGALLKHHVEERLHCDIKPGDRVFYFSTCGWMMWNWLVSALAQAATVVLYEGSPGQPDLNVLWRLAEKHNITFFGTSARFIHSLHAEGISPKETADLSALRTVASTGSPLSPTGFSYVYDGIKADVHLASISGGTDIVGCFMLGVPTRAVYAGQIQGPALGVDLVALDEAGEPVVGEPGELVCCQPLPSMPLEFWNDPDFTRYQDAYFAKYPGQWRHGDLIEITEQGGVVVYGRSDATLNPGGVRIGTAEVYRPLESLPEIVEACAVGKKEDGDEVIWLFVVLHEDETLSDDLTKRIKTTLRSEASPRHTPKRVFQVAQLPRTRSGKLVEVAVSRLVNGAEVPNREVMANPEALGEVERVVLSRGARGQGRKGT